MVLKSLLQRAVQKSGKYLWDDNLGSRLVGTTSQRVGRAAVGVGIGLGASNYMSYAADRQYAKTGRVDRGAYEGVGTALSVAGFASGAFGAVTNRSLVHVAGKGLITGTHKAATGLKRFSGKSWDSFEDLAQGFPTPIESTKAFMKAHPNVHKTAVYSGIGLGLVGAGAGYGVMTRNTVGMESSNIETANRTTRRMNFSTAGLVQALYERR